ncbi:DNA-deoxyinosine glycosylase [Pseudothauera lacus]|uniref:DNA-deoxyinosine glycosylase n=1 Tax=Pseudothauera lacus TaxID=2136175 RepID=A0A2T4IIX6_9RHOO|nr:DNA-deoxyinosine glycosylase [Pseudothauera lacus]PTD97721.1 DNA-deoxyinosine glycosylase [Pseudothauera lacus]
MTRIFGFPPIATAQARILILGSMPGQASLKAGEYYAHPRNAFWPIMGELLGFAAQADYGTRVAALDAAGVAVWDVLSSCVRPGSLDADIDTATMVANDFRAFFAVHPRIRRLYFNGAAAAASYRRSVLPQGEWADYPALRLPSTSPAHAGLSLAAKIAAWRALERDLGE